MVAEAHKVGPNRYRERFGRYFEDFTVGDIYEHRPNRTISETDNTWFTLADDESRIRCISTRSTPSTASSAAASSALR